MKQKIQSMRETIEARLSTVSSTAELREIRSAYLSRTGEIPALMKLLGSLPKEERPEAGKYINIWLQPFSVQFWYAKERVPKLSPKSEN